MTSGQTQQRTELASMHIRKYAITRAALLCASLGPSAAAAATIRVPSDVATVQGAIEASNPGDTVLVAKGIYFERLNFLGKAIELVSELGPSLTTIDAQGLGTAIKLEYVFGAGARIEGFTIKNGDGDFGGGIDLLLASPTIRRNIFVLNSSFGAAIYGSNASPIVEHNEFLANSCDSQFVSGVLSFANISSPRIFNNLIHDNDCRGLNLTMPREAQPVVFNNTLVRNPVGMHLDGLSNSGQIYRNNIVADNGIGLDVLVVFDDPLVAFWENNLLFANDLQYLGISDQTGINGNLSQDPQFVDSEFDYFALTPSSPAIDAGNAEGLPMPATDFEGSPRIQDATGKGPRVDIGAFEGQSQAIFASGFED